MGVFDESGSQRLKIFVHEAEQTSSRRKDKHALERFEVGNQPNRSVFVHQHRVRHAFFGSWCRMFNPASVWGQPLLEPAGRKRSTRPNG